MVFLFFVFLAQGQTTKRVMYEGFTSANCGPCVGNNAAIKPILAANPNKVVALKYHTSWPSPADFANQNTQTWVGPRVSYYGVTGVPTTRVNGTGTTLNQSVIDQQYTTTSPFFLEVNHTFNADSTQISVEVKIKAAQDYTGSQMVLHLAMIERLITFSSAPGNNGEREFNDVLRRMYPNASGTALANVWTNNQEQVLNFTVDVPSYVFKKNQIAFVAFIQSNTNLSILQAAKTTYPFDVIVLDSNLNEDPICGGVFVPQITFINSGENTITSLDISYGLEGSAGSVYHWTGSLVSGQTTRISLPALPVSGLSRVFLRISNLNQTSGEVYSTTGVAAVYSAGSFLGLNLEESFSNVNFPPSGWVTSSTGTNHAWHRHFTSGGAARIELHRTLQNQEDNLYVRPIDLTANGSFNISFKVAHAMINSTSHGPNDRLMVQFSKDCGQTWSTVYSKSGASLATAPNNGQTVFVPVASQWREETFGTSIFAGEPNVLMRFNVRSGVGNCLYIDDVRLIATSFFVNYGVEGANGKVVARLNGNPIQSGAAVPSGSSIIFTATPDPNYLIDHWIVNGVVIQGNQEPEITINNINGLKNVKVAFRNDNTGVEPIAQTIIKVFPVPARNQLNIVSCDFMHQLSLLNLLGQEVYSAADIGLNHIIDLRNLKGGFYVLRINTSKGLVTRKIQVE